MKYIKSDDIITPDFANGAILHDDPWGQANGFVEDYLVLHCLLRKYNPESILEIGTHTGKGTNIICNAAPHAKVFSLDLPLEEAYKSEQRLAGEVGQNCKLPYTQLYGDSMLFAFDSYPIWDAWYVDGEHDYKHALHESQQAIKCRAKLIIYHDSDIIDVFNGISDAFINNNDYELYRVSDTRILFAILKSV